MSHLPRSHGGFLKHPHTHIHVCTYAHMHVYYNLTHSALAEFCRLPMRTGQYCRITLKIVHCCRPERPCRVSPGVPGAYCENAGALGILQQPGWVTTLEPEPPRSAEAGAQLKHVPRADPSFCSPPSGVESVRTGHPAGRPGRRGSPCEPAGPGRDSGGVRFLEVFVCKSLGSQVHSEAKAS